LRHPHSLNTYRDFAKLSYGRSRSEANQRTPHNFGVKLMRRSHGVVSTLFGLHLHSTNEIKRCASHASGRAGSSNRDRMSIRSTYCDCCHRWRWRRSWCWWSGASLSTRGHIRPPKTRRHSQVWNKVRHHTARRKYGTGTTDAIER
jgi:hypothetical protein